jgi:cyanophycinase
VTSATTAGTVSGSIGCADWSTAKGGGCHAPRGVAVRLGFTTVVACIAWASLFLAAQSQSRGPARGSLVLAGGIEPNPAIDSAFRALAGGPSAQIVLIPTASLPDTMPSEMLPEVKVFLERRINERFGVSAVTMLHTYDRARADTDSFVAPLRRANGVWMMGGFPERLIQSYLSTKTELALRDLLDRGGVVGGESAGAMIQGSWLDTTDGEFTPQILKLMQAHAAGGGFGLLTRAAVFPHFDARGPEAAIKESAAHPDQLAIGIDNQTALIIKGNQIEAVGLGTVSLYNASGKGSSTSVILRSGERYDLAVRHKQQ